MKVFNKTLWKVLALFFIPLAVFVFVLYGVADKYAPVINQALEISTVTATGGGDGGSGEAYYKKSAYGTLEELYTAKVQLMREIAQEGTVLLKNNSNTLPLNGGKVIVLGEKDFRFETLSAGGTMGFTTGRTTLSAALRNAGFTVATSTSGATSSDAVLVVIGRAGGEGIDIKKDELALTASEKSLISQAKSSGAGKVIVLISGDFSPEIADLEKDNGIGAILKFGNAGYRGAYGLADVISGAVSPSGKLVDMFAAKAASAPASQNFGDFTYTNSGAIKGGLANRYVAYMEGIYTDYKYYETRYEDTVLGKGNAASTAGSSTASAWSYADEVVYSYGFGKSYTEFTQEIVGEPVFDAAAHTATIKVKVTNKGDVAGKDVVQIYGQAPYEHGRTTVEKASVQLLGYGKTDTLAAHTGEATLDVTVHMQWLASYDYKTAKGYIMDAGDYYFALGNGAHDALNNILAAKNLTADQKARMVGTGDASLTYKWTQESNDTDTYKKSLYNDGVRVTNAFDDADINYWLDTPVQYLSRSDWQATYPTPIALSATAKMLTVLNESRKYEKGVVDTKERVKEEEGYNGKVKYSGKKDYVSNSRLVNLMGKDYDDPDWQALLDDLSIYDMSNMVANGRYTIPAAKSVSSPEVTGNDNPTGLWNKYIYQSIDAETGKKKSVPDGMTLKDGITNDAVPVSEIQASMFCSEPGLAATFNNDLATRQGEMFSDDALYCGVSFTWGLGANLHRSPFGGRASEYFSSDPVHTTLMSAAWAKACSDRGHIMVEKHFVANEQEANRLGVCTFSNEQALRETYLRAFEGLAVYGEMNGLMTSYNRLGLVCSAAEYDLVTGVLRNEWDSKCYTITDLYSPTAGLYDGNAMVAAGTNIMLNGNKYDNESGSYVSTTLSVSKIKADPVLLYSVREACHRLMYVTVNSMAMNGITASTTFEDVTPWYFIMIIVFEVVFTVVAVGSAAMYLISVNLKKKEKEDK